MSLRDYLFHEEPGITLYCGDARLIVPLLCANTSYCLEMCSGACSLVIVSDPPYGIDHPTNYAERGRDMRPGYWARSRFSYPPVHGDADPFDPAWILALGRPTCLWGANHYASRLPDASGWLVWDKERPDDLDQATCELAWTNYVKGVRRFRWLWNGMMRASKEDLVHPTQKPLALMKWCLSMRWTPPGVVLGPLRGLRDHAGGRQGDRASGHRHRDRAPLLRDRGKAAAPGGAEPMTLLAFGLDTSTPVRCVKCGRPTLRRITRDMGLCVECDAVVKA